MATKGTADEAGDTYDQFIDRVEKISNVGHAAGVLRWDQEVMMPDEGTPARSKQLSTLSSIGHDLLTAEETGELLEELEDTELNQDQSAVVREIRRRYDRSTKVPTDLVEEISEATTNAHPVWTDAKADSDFSAFAPTLEELVDLKTEYAGHIDPDADPYTVLFQDYEPYIDIGTAERVLDRLSEALPPMIEAIRESGTDLAEPFDGEYDHDAQQRVVRDALDLLGYDWERGRLDTAPHPFSTGTQYDARVTTRFTDDDPLDSLGSTIHEFGHATYTLGLPDEGYGTPLGQARDLSVHESQSRFWENHVGRTREFWELFLPRMREHLDVGEVTPQQAYEAANRIKPDNLIRVEADELTYHLHIAVRFEIERELVSGDLDVREVPAVWNEKYDRYLGVRPENDAEGCLQDIHWSHGNFGYFPTYSLGSVLAAQLYAAAERDLGDLDEDIRNGSFDDLGEWLRENVHRHGARYTTDELVEEATGESYTADYFLEYVTEKYSDLYDL